MHSWLHPSTPLSLGTRNELAKTLAQEGPIRPTAVTMHLRLTFNFTAQVASLQFGSGRSI